MLLRLILVVGGAAIIGSLFFVCVLPIPGTVTYRSVSFQPTANRAEEGRLTRHEDSSSEYLVQDGTLYLRIQTVRHSIILVSCVSFDQWDTEKIAKFRDAHPELEDYWLARDLPDGGVRWLHSK